MATMRSSYVFDFKVATDFTGLIIALCEKGDACYLLGASDEPVEKIKDFISRLEEIGLCHYFITPKFEHKLETTAWNANTVRSVKPKLYMGIDPDTVEQTRLLGVPSALYRL
jgi:hypothetical protein